MGSNINIRARIERHSRVLQHNIYKQGKHTWKISLTIVSILSIFFLPIYPVFAGLVSSASEYDFYRWYIDESTIIDSYFSNDTSVWDGSVFIESKDSYLYVNTSLDSSERNITASREILEHEVLWGENISGIAARYGISSDTIRWENNLTSDKLKPGQVLKILPTSWLSHIVKSWETLGGLAEKYKISQEDIMRQNMLLTANDLKIWDVIIIPGAEKELPKPIVAPQTSKQAVVKNTNTSWKSGWYAFTEKSKSEYVQSTGRFQLTWRKPQHSFAWGNCTWYVAQYKNVNWWGNANQWLTNARAKGHATGSTPTLGSIVQLEGRGYNPRYGHVGIVTDITDSHIIVSDMNYRRINEVTTRKIPKNDAAIRWYIYID